MSDRQETPGSVAEIRRALRAYCDAVYAFDSRQQNDCFLPEELEKIAQAYRETTAVIDEVENPIARRVLQFRYLSRLSVSETARETFYSERHIKRLQQKAIDQILKNRSLGKTRNLHYSKSRPVGGLSPDEVPGGKPPGAPIQFIRGASEEDARERMNANES